MNRLLKTIIENNRKWISEGKVASYIPELSKMDKIYWVFLYVPWEGKNIGKAMLKLSLRFKVYQK